MASNAHAVLPSLYRKLSFDPVRDFVPISLLATSANVLVVHPSLPAGTLKQFIALAKSRPNEINYGSSGNGGTGHLAMERLKSMAGMRMVHIPYKTTAPLLNALISGEIAAAFNQIVITAPQVRAGRLRALAVSTAHRSAALPDVPTVAEAGVPGFEAAAWFGVLAPARTPSHIITKLNAEIVRIMKLRDVNERLSSEGVEVVGSTAEEFTAVVRSDVEKWGKVIKELRLVAD
jgi:tripartite-type tricarboxylate transporter receptor subunit TctC